MKSILEMERELFKESWNLRGASFEVAKNGNNYKKSKELQNKQNEVYKKQQFFKNFIKEMEKIEK